MRDRSISDTQRHGPGRGREVLQILHEVSRGLSRALIVVSVSVGVEVWCRGERRLTTRTLVLFLCNGPEGCDCFCRGPRAAEDFKAAGMSYGDKCNKM